MSDHCEPRKQIKLSLLYLPCQVRNWLVCQSLLVRIKNICIVVFTFCHIICHIKSKFLLGPGSVLVAFGHKSSPAGPLYILFVSPWYFLFPIFYFQNLFFDATNIFFVPKLFTLQQLFYPQNFSFTPKYFLLPLKHFF